MLLRPLVMLLQQQLRLQLLLLLSWLSGRLTRLSPSLYRSRTMQYSRQRQYKWTQQQSAQTRYSRQRQYK
jgi:hypothetical protein